MTESYIQAAAIGSAALVGVTGQTLERQTEHHRPESAGNRWTRLSAIKRRVGVVTLTTSSIKQIFDLMPQGTAPSVLDLPCMKLASDPLYLWAIGQQDDVPLPTAGSTHEKLTIAAGVLVARRLSWREPGEPAVLTVTAWPLSADGDASYWTAAQAALPSAPGIDADYTLDSMTIKTPVGGTAVAVEDFSDLELEFDLPARPRFKAPAHRFPTAISLGGSAGQCQANISWRSRDRSLLRAWGEGYKGSAISLVELIWKDYAQAAERGTTTLKMSLKCVLEAGPIEDGRPSTVQVRGQAVSSDGATAFLWGYA